MVGVVFGAVHGKGMDAWVALGKNSGTVALMNVEVNDEDAFEAVKVDEVVGTNDDVIEDAKTFASVIVGMVCAAGDIESSASVGEGVNGKVHGALTDGALAVDQLLGEGEANFSLRLSR